MPEPSLKEILVLWEHEAEHLRNRLKYCHRTTPEQKKADKAGLKLIVATMRKIKGVLFASAIISDIRG